MDPSPQTQTARMPLDIDSLRSEYESSREWGLRRKFLEMNSNSLNLDMLVCLSRCFVNIAMYGCLYSQSVMNEVQERSDGILDEVKSEKKIEAKLKYAASFVKASSDSEETFKNVQTNGCIADPKAVLQINCKPVNNIVVGNISCELQIPKTALGNRCETQAKKTTVANPSYYNQNSKMAEFGNISSEPQTSKMAAFGNISSEPKTSKTVEFGNISSEPQDSKTAEVGQKTKTAEVDQKTKTALSKDMCLLAYQTEKNPVLTKIRKLALEVLNLKVACQNAKEKLHCAADRVPVILDFNTEPVARRASSAFLCHVLIEGIELACEQGSNHKQAKTNACETALKTIMMPKIEIVEYPNKTKLLKGSDRPPNQNVCDIASIQPNICLRDSSDGSSQLPKDGDSFYKESNINSISLKRRYHPSKLLENFIIVEHVDNQCEIAANILRRSADFNGMLLEYDFFPLGVGTRCLVKIEGEIYADVVGSTKAIAKATASAQCLGKLKTLCWVLKTKQAVDSNSSISKDEIQKEIQLKSEHIGSENIGNKLLQKMGWSGGGIGKTGQGIAEPVSLMAVLNRQGLGLEDVTGVTVDFRKRIEEVVQNYVCSDNQEDLVFSNDFDIEERKVIHEVSRKLNLKSTSRGKGQDRYLCVSRKRSANQLFQHVMMCGGETAKYKLLPPGTDTS